MQDRRGRRGAGMIGSDCVGRMHVFISLVVLINILSLPISSGFYTKYTEPLEIQAKSTSVTSTLTMTSSSSTSISTPSPLTSTSKDTDVKAEDMNGWTKAGIIIACLGVPALLVTYAIYLYKTKKYCFRHKMKRRAVKDLQTYLVNLYTRTCNWENPLTGDEDRPITLFQMYVNPTIKLVRERNQETEPIGEQHCRPMPLSYEKIFKTNTEQCQNIYLTGNAGKGKTTFCKRLVQTWCKAIENNSDQEDSAEDVNELKVFTLLFYVNLREVESQYHIEEMIKTNLLHYKPTEYLSDILESEKCLVVLDGLDEWSCPQSAAICQGLNKHIPGRHTLNQNCTYLTTTRSWKFHVIDMKSIDCDKHVELCGLDNDSAKELANKTINQLGGNHFCHTPKFFQNIEENKLYSLTTVPVFLILLVTLWHKGMKAAMTQVQLYSKMIEVLVYDAIKNLPKKEINTNFELPGCFSEYCYDNNYFAHLINRLSMLAFTSLLKTNKVDSLIFRERTLRDCGIKSDDRELCLKCGILTQDKDLNSIDGRSSKYSFLHKKLQEFLAAVHLVTSPNVSSDMMSIKVYLDETDTILEMEQMFMFVCGMNVDLGYELLNILNNAVSRNKSVLNSRLSIDDERVINDIQTCVLDCVAELYRTFVKVKFPLQDHYIDNETMSIYSNYVLENLKEEEASIKSMYISTRGCEEEDVTKVLTHLQEKANVLEKLWVRNWTDVKSDKDIVKSVLTANVRTLKSLCLWDFGLELLNAVLICIPSLHALMLVDDLEIMETGKTGLTHDHIENLLKKIQNANLTHLHLCLYCMTHSGECRPDVDLKSHTDLQTLKLTDMRVTNLQEVAQRVENVKLVNITVVQDTLITFIEALLQSPNKMKVILRNVTVESGDPAFVKSRFRDKVVFIDHDQKYEIDSDNTLSFIKLYKE